MKFAGYTASAIYCTFASEVFTERLMPDDVAETPQFLFGLWADLAGHQSPNENTKHPPWTT